MGTTTSSFYRDKLAMRTGAKGLGSWFLNLPLLNYDELRDYMDASPPGLKPAEASVWHPQD